jgi:hypothetical protein
VVRIDAIFSRVITNPVDAFAEILHHLLRAKPGARPGSNGKDRVAASAKDLKKLSALVISDFPAVGVPCPRHDIDDSNAVPLAEGRKDIHRQSHAIGLAKDDVLLLFVRRRLRS